MAHISGRTLEKLDNPRDVIITEQLYHRPNSDAGDRKVAALSRLANELSGTPAEMLHRLMAEAMTLCNADTVGLSVLRKDDQGEHFFWQDMAGHLAEHVGGRTPREWSPCGTTLNSGRPELFLLPGRVFHYFLNVDPQIYEGLVVPVEVDGKYVATVWVVHHDDRKRFILSDVDAMTSLASFTGAAISHMNGKAGQASA